MDNHTDSGGSVLADAFSRRLTQLGLSRRELVKRTGLSRQTLHNIEHGGKTDLRPATWQALDSGLYWRPGTAMALAHGDASVLDQPDLMMHQDKESAYRWRIVEKIQRMSLTELERMVSMMEGEALGEDAPLDTESVIARVEETVLRRIEQRLANNGQTPR